ncbi:hypothetical protein SD80_014010 [Scytonema tolypothrichoides VB-61278]|nr:hypothetical protein SD80_014010 [Scytonema tolypothrichoides VB-61278]
MYSQMLRAFTLYSPILTESPLVKVPLLIKGVTPKAKVIVLNTTQNKKAKIAKVFIPHIYISGVPISHQQLETQESGTVQLNKQI